MVDMSIVEGIRIERRPGWVMMYIASPLIPCAYIDIPKATLVERGPTGTRLRRYPALTLAIRTNFYCNATAVDRIMWNGYTRAGVVIVAGDEVKLKIGQYIKPRIREFFSWLLGKR
jgi:hypothetical protein